MIIHQPALAGRFLNRPMALLPSHSRLILDMLSSPTALVGQARETRVYRPYDLYGGVAVIDIRGVLVHGEDWMFWGRQTSYAQIRACLDQAAGDDAVQAIALHIDSPGGDCCGCWDVADAIYEMRGSLPIIAIVDEAAYSAAYMIASAADEIIVPRSGGVGSVGVIAQHTSLAGMLKQAGIEISTFTFGERKADGNIAVPLSEDAAASIQADVDALGEMFVETVARNRGMTTAAVRGLQAATYLGAAGVAIGLADAVMSPDAALSAIADQVD